MPVTVTVRVLVVACILAGAMPARAGIGFDEGTASAGITATGPTFGASWFDREFDGRPDIWVGHHGQPPVLHANQGGGAFADRIPQIWPGPVRDSHGASWADFDGDGDQDLLEAVGGSASHPARLWENRSPVLVDVAASLGVAFPGDRGRMSTWVDLDRDGWLDLVVGNAQGATASRILANRNGRFQDVTQETGFQVPGTDYVQLADIDDDGVGELVVHGIRFPFRVYDLPWDGQTPLVDLRPQLGIPTHPGPAAMDSVIADLTGDGRTDVLVTKVGANHEFLQTSPQQILARVNAAADERGVAFTSVAPIDLQIFPTGQITLIPPEDFVRIGASGWAPTEMEIRLDPGDPAVWGTAPHLPTDEGFWIGYDPATTTWTVTMSTPRSLAVNFVIQGDASLGVPQPLGYGTTPPDPLPHFFVKTDAGFVESRAAAGLDVGLPCPSVVSGDLDNDMDLDLYFACAHPVHNVPNRLFENLGDGTFREVPGAGGASGSALGRADAVIVADYDLDGFLDLFVVNGEGAKPWNDGPHQLFRNRGNGNHWIGLDLRDGPGNATGKGASVRVTAGGVVQTRFQGGGVHRRSTDGERIHVGLGPHTMVDSVEVVWPSGGTTVRRNLPADAVYLIGKPVSRGCGLGAELAVLVPLLDLLRRRRVGPRP